MAVKPTRPRYRFTKVTIDNWRNFEHAHATLQARMFLIGPNASGKSNFLDIFRFLQDIVAVGGGFQEAVLRRGGVSSLRSLSARRYPAIGIEVTVGNQEAPNCWRYRLTFTQDNQGRPLINTEEVWRAGKQMFSRPNDEDVKDPERLTQTFIEQVNMNLASREMVEFFASTSYLHVVPQLVRDPARSVGKHNDPFGGDLLERVFRTPVKTRDSRLSRIRDALAAVVPNLEELKIERDEGGVAHLRMRYAHWRLNGAWQEEGQFSDGTLRLVGLLWALQDGQGPLLLEEPEMSLHPDAVRCLPQMFERVQRKSRRQILVSTHSSEMLSDSGVGLDETLILTIKKEGTSLVPANEVNDIVQLVSNGLSLDAAVLPHTRPAGASQLKLFGE